MRIVENFPPPPPKPLRTFDLMGVSEEELKHLRLVLLNAVTENYTLTAYLYGQVDRALA